MTRLNVLNVEYLLVLLDESLEGVGLWVALVHDERIFELVLKAFRPVEDYVVPVDKIK